jgi:hypothetical protein
LNKRNRPRYVLGAAISISLGIALVVPSIGVAEAATPPAALNGAVAAFEASNDNLYLCDIPPNGCTNTSLGMELGASPAVFSEDNGLVWAAFEANTKDLYVTERSSGGAVKNINTGLAMDNLTTPSITEYITDPNSTSGVIVAYHGTNGNLDIYSYDKTTGTSAVLNTGLPMYPGTSPSTVAATDGFTDSTELVTAFANPADHLGIAYLEINDGSDYYNGASTETTLGMDAGTSPSITANSSTPSYAVAFNDNAKELYLAYFGYDASQSSMTLENKSSVSLYPGASPTEIQTKYIGARSNEVSVYEGGGGEFCSWNDASAKQACYSGQLVIGNPAVALAKGDYWGAFESGASGNFRGYNTATGSYFEQPISNGTSPALSE